MFFPLLVGCEILLDKNPKAHFTMTQMPGLDRQCYGLNYRPLYFLHDDSLASKLV